MLSRPDSKIRQKKKIPFLLPPLFHIFFQRLVIFFFIKAKYIYLKNLQPH